MRTFGDPVVVHEALGSEWWLLSLEVVTRAGGLDFGASEAVLCAPGCSFAPHRRRGRLARNRTLELLETRHIGEPLDTRLRIGVLDELLGECLVREDEVVFQRWSGDDYALVPPRRAMPGDGCYGVVGSDRMWQAMFAELDGSPVLTWLDGADAELVAREPLEPELHSGRLTATSEGVAIANGPDSEGSVRIVRWVSTSMQSDVRHEGFAPGTAPAGVTSWPESPGALALSAHRSDGVLELRHVGARGEEFSRVELSFSMHADVTPAVAVAPFGVVVATLNFGDEDPTAGALEAHLVVGGAARSRIEWPVRRRGSGFVAATTIEDVVVVHFTDVDGAGRSRTLAWVVGCE